MLIPVDDVLRLLDRFLQFRDLLVERLHASSPLQVVDRYNADVVLVGEQLGEFSFLGGKARMAWGPFVSRRWMEMRMTSICFMMCVPFRKK